MKNLLSRALLLALAFAASPAAAQTTGSSVQAPNGYAPMSAPCTKQVDGTCVPVAATAPLPVIAQGNTASATVDAGSPVKTGCVFLTAPTSVTNGQRVDNRCTAQGYTIVVNQAGELHIGEMGSNQTVNTVPLTVTASTYSAGQAIGGLMTITAAARVSGTIGTAGTSGIVQSVIINTKSTQTTPMDVFLFSSNPTASTCSNGVTFNVAVADYTKVLGVVPVTSWFSTGPVGSTGQAQSLSVPYALVSSTTLYACAVARGTPTFTDPTDVAIAFAMLRN